MMLVAAKQIKITPFLDKHIINSSYTNSAASDNTYHDDARSKCFSFLAFLEPSAEETDCFCRGFCIPLVFYWKTGEFSRAKVF